LVHVEKATGKAVFKVESGSYTFKSVTDALNEN
jgi:hypothetical protein